METHQLGQSSLLVSPLGLGCMGMSAYYGKPDEDEAIATIHRALELGINFFDTVDMYAAGRNEELLGRAIRRANMIHPITALQTEYSLWSREPENRLLGLCRELGIGFVAYSPLGRGFLAGTINRVDDLSPNDSRLRTPRFEQPNLERNRELISRLRGVARRNDCTVAQLSLAWLLSRRGKIVPIPGTKRRGYLEENVAALAIQLTSFDLAEIDEIMRNGAAVGARYSAPMLRLVDR